MSQGLLKLADWLEFTSNNAKMDLLLWREELNRLVMDECLAKSLNDIISSNKGIDDLATRSFVHPTGAFKIVLVTMGYEGPELRLHLWPTGINIECANNYESIHNHKWPFVSRIMAGRFIERLFMPHDHGRKFQRYIFRSPVPGKVYQSDYEDDVLLEETFSCYMSKGDSYYQSNKLLHMLYPASTSFSGTLFVRLAYQAGETTVCMPYNKEPIKDTGVLTRIEPLTISKLLQRVISSHE